MVSGLMISMRPSDCKRPALFQRIAGKFQRASVNIGEYAKKRDVLYEILMEAGFECVKPMGAFYMFPKSPIPDELDSFERSNRKKGLWSFREGLREKRLFQNSLLRTDGDNTEKPRGVYQNRKTL